VDRKTERAIREARRQLPGLRNHDSYIGRAGGDLVGPLLAHIDYLTALCLDAYDVMSENAEGETPVMKRLRAVEPGTAIRERTVGRPEKAAVWRRWAGPGGRESLWHFFPPGSYGTRSVCGKRVSGPRTAVARKEEHLSPNETCGTCFNKRKDV